MVNELRDDPLSFLETLAGFKLFLSLHGFFSRRKAFPMHHKRQSHALGPATLPIAVLIVAQNEMISLTHVAGVGQAIEDINEKFHIGWVAWNKEEMG